MNYEIVTNVKDDEILRGSGTVDFSGIVSRIKMSLMLGKYDNI